MRLFHRIASSLVLPILLAGCATNSPINVSLVHVHFANATLLESTGSFTVRINNESPESLHLDGGVHKIYLEGMYVGEGLSNESVEIPRLSSGTQVVEVHLNNLLMATRLKPILESHRFEYKINSLLYSNQIGRAHV